MSALNVKTQSREDVLKFINSFDTVLTDCDGVLWLENYKISGSDDAMNAFRKLGKRVFFVTNNSSKTRSELLEKFHQLNFEASEEEILCTAYLAANYLKDLSFSKKVYVVGKTSITRELDRYGIRHLGVGPDLTKVNNLYGLDVELDPEVGAVVVGFDEHYNYAKMIKAASYLRDPDVLFVATNTDEQYPVPSASDPSVKLIVPGTGSIVSGLETCAGRKATVMGKPERYIVEYIQRKFNADPGRTLMIGDRANTDILLGTRCGFQRLLVLSGVTGLDEVETWRRSFREEELDLVPDFYIDKLGDLLPYLEQLQSEGAASDEPVT